MASILNPTTDGTGVAPGPSIAETIRLNVKFTQDQIGTLRETKDKYGDVVKMRLGPYLNYSFYHPDAIEEILVKQNAVMNKDVITHDLESLLGQGLLTSEGDHWKKHRKIASPPLRKKHIRGYGADMARITDEAIADWKIGDTLEIHDTMMELTLRIVVKTLFNLQADDHETIESVSEAMEIAMTTFHKRNHTFWRFVPKSIPTHLDRNFAKARATLDKVIYKMIDDRRADASEGEDLLGRLIAARDEDGEPMDDEQLRDEALTMFLAGHETTALATSYAFYLLSSHPDAAHRMQKEVLTVVGDRLPGVDDLPDLKFTKQVVQESMRLYSPAWMIARQNTEDVVIAGHLVPEGTQILMCQNLIHRDARWFPNPDAFEPDRWTKEFEEHLPRFAYFPFGGGGRVCIGNHFAMMEVILVLATIARRFHLHDVSEEPLQTEPAVTLRPITRMDMRVAPVID